MSARKFNKHTQSDEQQLQPLPKTVAGTGADALEAGVNLAMFAGAALQGDVGEIPGWLAGLQQANAFSRTDVTSWTIAQCNVYMYLYNEPIFGMGDLVGARRSAILQHLCG